MNKQIKDFAQKQLTRSRIINITLLIVAFATLGLFDFVNLEFRLDHLTKFSFWLMVVLHGFAYSAIFFSFSDEATQRLIIESSDFQERKNYIDKISKYYRGAELNNYLVVYNRGVKIETYKHDINDKISKLDKEADKNGDFTNQREWYNYIKELKVSPDAVSENEYCIKRKYLLDILEDDYINENIDNIDVKFDITYATELTTGKESLGVGKSPLKVNADAVRTKRATLRILRYVSLTALFGIFLFQPQDASLIVPTLLNTIKTLFIIIMTIIAGLGDGKKQFETIEYPKKEFAYQRLKDYVRFEIAVNGYNVETQGKVKSDPLND